MDDILLFRKKIIQSASVILVIVAVGIAVSLLLFNQISKKAAEVTGKKKLLFSLEQEKLNFDNLEKDYAKVKPYFATVKGALPDEENLFRILEALQNAGLKSGLQTSLKLNSQSVLPAGIDGVQYIPFELAVDGNWSTLRDYLKTIDGLPIFTDIDSVSLSSPNSITASGGAILRGKIFIRQTAY